MGSTDIYDVLIALIANVGSIVGAGISIYVVRQLRTPSGTRIGRQVEDNRHVTLANHYLLRSTARDVGIETPPGTTREVAKVDEIEANGETDGQ